MSSCLVPFCWDGVHFLRFWSLKAWFAESFFVLNQYSEPNKSGQLSPDGHGDWANHFKRIFRRVRSKNYNKQYFESFFWFDWFIFNCSWTHKKEIQFTNNFCKKNDHKQKIHEFSKRDYISFGVCRLIMYALMSLSYGFMAASQEKYHSNQIKIIILSLTISYEP